ncbi:glycosyltransferase [Pelagibacterales bacterium SAG-MED28]|nr:glycosyltransferase [Pelagibacterales bacterium SAG-MED28]|tara:strand:- start:1709 stop:2557 length:849 start_codon:yes stop_codon:yes gene_type:complete
MFSIIIPTFNNLNYLRLCLDSIKKNSKFNHEILVHVNDGSDGTIEHLKSNKISYTHSYKNIGLCSSLNLVAKQSSKKYLLYSHDDMYFCPGWDICLSEELNNTKHDLFYFSGTMIEPFRGAHLSYDCGKSIDTFNEKKLIENFSSLSFYDHQGTHFAPHLISKRIWDLVGGFSEEFNPGMGSDPDFNMKLWNEGVRIFKGINDFRVYHFSSITTRKKIEVKKNRGEITFLKKWGFSTKFFKKYYLKSRSIYDGELSNPVKNIFYFLDLYLCKLKKFYFTLFD